MGLPACSRSHLKCLVVQVVKVDAFVIGDINTLVDHVNLHFLRVRSLEYYAFLAVGDCQRTQVQPIGDRLLISWVDAVKQEEMEEKGNW